MVSIFTAIRKNVRDAFSPKIIYGFCFSVLEKLRGQKSKKMSCTDYSKNTKEINPIKVIS